MKFKKNNETIIIDIGESFKFSFYKEFRAAYENLDIKTNKITIDLNDTKFIDSSALGMLLQMKESLSANDSFIKIINCNPDIYHLLCYCKFNTLFDISSKE